MPEVGLEQKQPNSSANGTADVAAKLKKPRTRGTTTRNATVVAIAKISNVLDALEGEERTGVLTFINGQYK